MLAEGETLQAATDKVIGWMQRRDSKLWSARELTRFFLMWVLELSPKVLSHRVSAMDTLDLIIVSGRYGRCGSLGATTSDIPLVQDVARSFSLLLSEEESRIARKGDTAAAVAPTPFVPALSSCNHVDSAAADLRGQFRSRIHQGACPFSLDYPFIEPALRGMGHVVVPSLLGRSLRVLGHR